MCKQQQVHSISKEWGSPSNPKMFLYFCGNFQPHDASKVSMNFCATNQQEEANKEQSQSESGSIPCKHSTPKTRWMYCLLPNKQDGTDQLNESKDKHEKRERNGSRVSLREETHRIFRCHRCADFYYLPEKGTPEQTYSRALVSTTPKG